jgi:hypothetical protein
MATLNYRAVTLLYKTYKILANVLCANLVPYAEEIIGKCQRGFRRGSSTNDHIFTMRKMLESFGNVIKMDIIYLLILRQHITLCGEKKHAVKCI